MSAEFAIELGLLLLAVGGLVASFVYARTRKRVWHWVWLALVWSEVGLRKLRKTRKYDPKIG